MCVSQREQWAWDYLTWLLRLRAGQRIQYGGGGGDCYIKKVVAIPPKECIDKCECRLFLKLDVIVCENSYDRRFEKLKIVLLSM